MAQAKSLTAVMAMDVIPIAAFDSIDISRTKAGGWKVEVFADSLPADFDGVVVASDDPAVVLAALSDILDRLAGQTMTLRVTRRNGVLTAEVTPEE